MRVQPLTYLGIKRAVDLQRKCPWSHWCVSSQSQVVSELNMETISRQMLGIISRTMGISIALSTTRMTFLHQGFTRQVAVARHPCRHVLGCHESHGL